MKYNTKMNFALALIIVGAIYALKNIFGINIFAGVSVIDFDMIWPLIIIGIGVYLLVKNSK